MRSFLAALMLCLLSTCGTLTPVLAQHNHAAGHNDYAGWSTPTVRDCCNNKDCGILKEDEVRETAAGTQIKIEGKWCPVEHRHYITKGKSPDFNSSHACIRAPYSNFDEETGTELPPEDPCGRLLCYSGKGGV